MKQVVFCALALAFTWLVFGAFFADKAEARWCVERTCIKHARPNCHRPQWICGRDPGGCIAWRVHRYHVFGALCGRTF